MSGATRSSSSITPVAFSLGTDLPDHAGARNLHERRVSADLEAGIRVGATKIADGTVVGDIGATIRAEPYIGRPVEPADTVRKSFLEALVVCEALDAHGERLTR